MLIVGALPLLVLAAPPLPRPVAIATEMDRLSDPPPWPGFDPRRIPLAIFDGERTWLFRHPQPPADFQPVPGAPGAFSHPGLDAALRANTSADLGAVVTATVLLDQRDLERPLRELAGLAIHEAFHVFQAQHHPDWGGNEGELFTYPVDDHGLLALRRLESRALRLAVAVRGGRATAIWAGAALALRRERFAKLPAGAAAYERGTELKEGLAQYVEDKAAGGRPLNRFPAGEFPPDEVRQRAYASGQALAVLLDRLDPGWARTLDSGAAGSLEDLFAAALARQPGRAGTLPAEERREAEAAARADVASLLARRAERLAAFRSRPGFAVVVVASDEAPLWPQGFDPWNVLALDDAQVLHSRFLRLGNDAGSLEALGHEALTEGVGPHPLFAGVRRVTLTGLDAEPSVEEAEGRCVVRAKGLTAELTGARVDRIERTLLIRLGASR